MEGRTSLQDKWKLEGPCARKWNDDFPICSTSATNEGGRDRDLIDDNDIDSYEFDAADAIKRDGWESRESCSTPSAFQLTYDVHKHQKIIKYRIFQKDCRQEFQGRDVPLVGSGKIDNSTDDAGESFYVVQRSKLNDDDDSSNQAVSIEFIPTDIGEKLDIIEFCIRLGLWLPPESGGLEVNFRQTNVVVTFADDQEFVRIVQSVELDPLPLVAVTLNIFGSDNNSPPQTVDQ